MMKNSDEAKRDMLPSAVCTKEGDGWKLTAVAGDLFRECLRRSVDIKTKWDIEFLFVGPGILLLPGTKALVATDGMRLLAIEGFHDIKDGHYEVGAGGELSLAEPTGKSVPPWHKLFLSSQKSGELPGNGKMIYSGRDTEAIFDALSGKADMWIDKSLCEPILRGALRLVSGDLRLLVHSEKTADSHFQVTGYIPPSGREKCAWLTYMQMPLIRR
jgi:hypothetical protein